MSATRCSVGGRRQRVVRPTPTSSTSFSARPGAAEVAERTGWVTGRGRRVSVADVEGLALANAFSLNYPDQSDSALLLHVGHRSTVMCVIERGELIATRGVGLGGGAQDLVAAIRQAATPESPGRVFLSGGGWEAEGLSSRLASRVRRACRSVRPTTPHPDVGGEPGSGPRGTSVCVGGRPGTAPQGGRVITINLLVNGQTRRRTVRPILNGVCLVATCAALAADWWYLRESRTALLAQSVALDRELTAITTSATRLDQVRRRQTELVAELSHGQPHPRRSQYVHRAVRGDQSQPHGRSVAD